MEEKILTELFEGSVKETAVFTYVLHGVCTEGFCVLAGFDICERFCFRTTTVGAETGKTLVTLGSSVPWLVTATVFCTDTFLVSLYSIGNLYKYDATSNIATFLRFISFICG
jgi:hypothetical protein